MLDTTTTMAPSTRTEVPPLTESHIPPQDPTPGLYPHEPSVDMAVDGTLNKLRTGTHPGPRHGGGQRGIIRGKSRGSGRRLMYSLAELDQATHPAARTMFTVLTWPAEWPEDPEEWANTLESWRKRLERCFNRKFSGVWLKEIQRRGAPHFHVLLFAPDGLPIGPLMRRAREAWFELTGGGVYIEPVTSWKGTRAYLGKAEKLVRLERGEDGEILPTGRLYGWFRKKVLKIGYVRVALTGAAFIKLRRVFRRAARPEKGRQRLRGRAGVFGTQTAMIPYGEMLRLLELLGVSPP